MLGALADDAGVLEAMQAFDRTGARVPDLCVATVLGTTYDVVWKAVPDHNPDGARRRSSARSSTAPGAA